VAILLRRGGALLILNATTKTLLVSVATIAQIESHTSVLLAVLLASCDTSAEGFWSSEATPASTAILTSVAGAALATELGHHVGSSIDFRRQKCLEVLDTGQQYSRFA
jgi:hypothetical protein